MTRKKHKYDTNIKMSDLYIPHRRIFVVNQFPRQTSKQFPIKSTIFGASHTPYQRFDLNQWLNKLQNLKY